MIRRKPCDSLSRQLSRHIGHTSRVISRRLRKITTCPSTSSIRCSGESSATTDQKCSGSSARLMRTIWRRQWLVNFAGMPKCRMATPSFSSTFQHRPNTSQNNASFLLNAHNRSLIFNCMVRRISPTARIIRQTGKARIRSMKIAFGVLSWLSLRNDPTAAASFSWYALSHFSRQRITPAISSKGSPARNAMNTAGQAFSQFTVIFIDLN